MEQDYRKRRKERILGKKYSSPRYSPFRYPTPKPDFPTNVRFLASVPKAFSKKRYKASKDSGYFEVPVCFSLIENYEESFDFLKRLFIVLYGESVKTIILDYKKCKRIDVDASICMDILLAEFITYYKICKRNGHKSSLKAINPINYSENSVMKVLFSIGAYANLRGINIKYEDVEPLKVLINDNTRSDVWTNSEMHQTRIVEYIKKCLTKLNRELTVEAETEIYKVLGEVMNNAEEHGTQPHRFAVGYFHDSHNEDGHFGIFNFSIFNFGKTIYETFKNNNEVNDDVIRQMELLSHDYTQKGLFKGAEFEEETLWTLYALQEGVTSKKTDKRGNGSIQYIENFFKIKGDLSKDNTSRLVILSGNTRILFDGTYGIVEKVKPESGRKYKMITFNNSNEISDQPDKNFVTFAPHFFPGTLISARILITSNNTKEQLYGAKSI